MPTMPTVGHISRCDTLTDRYRAISHSLNLALQNLHEFGLPHCQDYPVSAAWEKAVHEFYVRQALLQKIRDDTLAIIENLKQQKDLIA